MDTAAPERLIEHFSKLVDPRVESGTKRHELIDVIVPCVCAVKRRRGRKWATGTRSAGERWSLDFVSDVLASRRRLPKRSSGQSGRPAPLRSAGHPAWAKEHQCTNVQTVPLGGDRSLVYQALIFVDSDSCFSWQA